MQLENKKKHISQFMCTFIFDIFKVNRGKFVNVNFSKNVFSITRSSQAFWHHSNGAFSLIKKLEVPPIASVFLFVFNLIWGNFMSKILIFYNFIRMQKQKTMKIYLKGLHVCIFANVFGYYLDKMTVQW